MLQIRFGRFCRILGLSLACVGSAFGSVEAATVRFTFDSYDAELLEPLLAPSLESPVETELRIIETGGDIAPLTLAYLLDESLTADQSESELTVRDTLLSLTELDLRFTGSLEDTSVIALPQVGASETDFGIYTFPDARLGGPRRPGLIVAFEPPARSASPRQNLASRLNQSIQLYADRSRISTYRPSSRVSFLLASGNNQTRDFFLLELEETFEAYVRDSLANNPRNELPTAPSDEFALRLKNSDAFDTAEKFGFVNLEINLQLLPTREQRQQRRGVIPAELTEIEELQLELNRELGQLQRQRERSASNL